MSVPKAEKIAIAAGGTAGHVVPALAVAHALKALGHECVFFGGERAEAQMVPEAGFEFKKIRVEPLSRSNPIKAVRAAFRALFAVWAGRKLLRRARVSAVMAGGGYVAGPVGFAAWTLRIPLLITEADAHLGVANRLLAPVASRVCLAFALPGRTGSKYRVTGRPIATRTTTLSRSAARRSFGLPVEGHCLLVFGGSLGARSLNRAAIDAFGDAPPPGSCVLHLTGHGDFEESSQLLRRSKSPASYKLLDFTDRFDHALACADLAVCRAGGSIFELAAAGVGSILVPYPRASADHQAKNARWLVDGGAAIMVRDEDLTARQLREHVLELFASDLQLAEMGAAARRLSMPNAAAEIANELSALAKDRK